MFYIANENVFNIMKGITNYSGYMNNLLKDNFYLLLYHDTKLMIRGDSSFNKIPERFRDEALQDIQQDVACSVHNSLNKFVYDGKSVHGGARVNWLKRVVSRRIADWKRSHPDEMCGDSFEEIEHTVASSDNSFDVFDYFEPVKRVAKYHVLFTDIDYRIQSKICFLYKDVECIVGKAGKNGGLSNKHNVLTKLKDRTLFDIADDIPEEIGKVCAADIPEESMKEIMNSINKDLFCKNRKYDYKGEYVFEMSYGYAVRECSEIKRELEKYDSVINDRTVKILKEMEDRYISI